MTDAFQRRDIILLPDFPKIEAREPVLRWIDKETQMSILTHAGCPVRYAFLLFLCEQGCRPNEARALKWGTIDFKADEVVISAGFDLNRYKTYTKENDVRYLPLHPGVKEALLKIKPDIANPDHFVFQLEGKPITRDRAHSIWKKATGKAGIEITMYEGTRHSFASQAINGGCHERTIGIFMGHKDLSSTRRYAKLKTDTLKRVWGEVVPIKSDTPKTENEG